MQDKTSYVVEYSGDRPCDVVYSVDAVTRVARGAPIARVTERLSRWTGSWDTDPPTRGYRVLRKRVMQPEEYS